MIYEQKSTNYIETITDIDTFIELWSFFCEGLTAMNDPKGSNMEETTEGFFRMMSKMLTSGGLIAVLKSKNGKLLGFGAGFNASTPHSPYKLFYVYATYSNGKYAQATKDMITWLRTWAKQNDYNRIAMETGRVNGGACRFFTRLGFDTRKLIFTMELE